MDQYTRQIGFFIKLDPGQGGRALSHLVDIVSEAIQQNGGEVLTGPCGPVGTANGALFNLEVRADFAQDPIENANKASWAIRHAVPSQVYWDALIPVALYVQEVDRATTAISSRRSS